jgi:hypothetical protein
MSGALLRAPFDIKHISWSGLWRENGCLLERADHGSGVCEQMPTSAWRSDVSPPVGTQITCVSWFPLVPSS